MDKHNTFFACLGRMKFINRWSLMKNTSVENLSMHTHETALLAHCLAVINNVYFAGDVSPEKAVMFALYHDCAEIFTGDMPTPVKYGGERMKRAYDEIEQEAKNKLLSRLPDEIRGCYQGLFQANDSKEYALMKQADKLCAYIKCIEERKVGNKEFLLAEKAIKAELEQKALPETKYFMQHFLPAYELTLDETENF